MNFEGVEWGNQGHFQIINSKNQVITPYFYKLSPKQQQMGNQDKIQFGKDKINSLVTKNQTNIDYECPNCHINSKIREYEGSISRAKCPRCLREFNPKSKDLIATLYKKIFK